MLWDPHPITPRRERLRISPEGHLRDHLVVLKILPSILGALIIREGRLTKNTLSRAETEDVSNPFLAPTGVYDCAILVWNTSAKS